MPQQKAHTHRRPRFDWNLLHTFVAIVEERSITRAANRMLLRQPTVTNALKRLEAQLGKHLVNRRTGHFQLTEHGLVLYRECQEICGAINRLHQLMEDDGAELSGDLRIHMASHVVFPPLDETLADFHARHPRVAMDIEVATSATVIQAVLAQDATFGICLVSDPHPRLTYRHIFREHFGFFCGPRHHLFGRRRLRIDDLRDETFVSFKTDRLTDALRPVAVLRAQLEMHGPVIGTSSHLEEVRRMVVAGLGIGPLPIHVVERDVRDGLLWRLPPYREPPAIDIFVVTNPGATLSRAETHFVDALLSRSLIERLGPLVFPGNQRLDSSDSAAPDET